MIAADAQKRRFLEDLLRPFRFRLTRGLSAERMADERRLVNRRVSLLKQIRRERELILTADPASEIMPKLQARAAALEKELTSVRTEAGEWQQAVARDLPSLVYLRGEASFTSLEPLAAVLPPNAAFIHFVVGDDRTSVIVATHPRASSEGTGARTDGGDEGTNRQAAPRLDVHAFTVALTRQQLAEQVWRYTDGIAKRADTVMADGRALYELLLAPAADRIAGRTTLVIVPDDALWTLPFEALMPAEGRYLIEDAAITLLPSAAAWLSRPDRRRRTTADRHRRDRRGERHRPLPDASDIPARRPAAAASRRRTGGHGRGHGNEYRGRASVDDARGMGVVRARSHDARSRAGRCHAEGGAAAPRRGPAGADGAVLGAAGGGCPACHLLAAPRRP